MREDLPEEDLREDLRDDLREDLRELEGYGLIDGFREGFSLGARIFTLGIALASSSRT